MQLVGRCILFYVIIVVALRLMGKREVGELSVLDVVIAFVMSELLALSISNLDFSPFKAIAGIGVLVLLQYLVSWVCIKSKKIRDFFEGEPVCIIYKGVINQKEMLRHRYTIDDLLVQLRSADCFDLNEVEFAILENSGQLSVSKTAHCLLEYPFPLISDGIIQKKHVLALGYDEKWLVEQCLQLNKHPESIFIAMWTKEGLFVIDKQS